MSDKYLIAGVATNTHREHGTVSVLLHVDAGIGMCTPVAVLEEAARKRAVGMLKKLTGMDAIHSDGVSLFPMSAKMVRIDA